MSELKHTNMLSVKELDEVLRKLQNKEKLTSIGTFSEVDIVFVAGLFLWYMQHKQGWKKIPQFLSLTANYKSWSHSYYFKQIDELYGIKPDQIFDDFPNAYNKKANSYSKLFAPPIYITKESLDCFFGEKTNKNIDTLKNIYIAEFNISDFINKKVKNYSDSESKFIKFETEIKDRLKKYPPIFTFIFIIASKNLAKKENENFDRRIDYIEKLLLFSQDYVRGLYELSKNIVEHSGKNGQKGEGMITIRAYNKIGTDKTRILETHVFDYGNKGIIPKLIEYTTEKATGSNVKNHRIKKCYFADNIFFKENENYKLKDFIEPNKGNELNQQTFRHTSHYGINKLHRLIRTTLNSKMFVASKGKKERDYFGENAENLTIKNGTHYYFKIPFEQKNFKNIVAKPFSQENQTATLGETASLEFLSKINIVQKKISQLSEIQLTTENSLINITLDDEKITKKNVDNIYNSLDRLSELKDNNRIAINLQDKINDVSVLLRFLSYLTFEYKQPFIIYNIDYLIYKELLADNRDFHGSRKGEAYWHSEQAMLLFVKTDKEFYFADILFGTNRDEFLFVNNIVNKTFPNTITLLEEIDNKKRGRQPDYIKSINSSQNLQQFFYPKSNILLPFDTLLKNKYDGNPLFVSNLTKILKNPLFNRKDTYSRLNEYIDNFDGFRIVNTHFKIGTKIHSEDFYYAKRLFQNSFYTARLAMLLAIKIMEKIPNTNQNITLVGYEMYSELLLSLIEKFLKDFGFNKEKENEDERVNHFITQSDDENFKFLPFNTFKKYLQNYKNRITIIIVPIAATGSTANKIEHDIREQIYKHEKTDNDKSVREARKLAEKCIFQEPHFNILLAQPEKGFETIKKSSENQTVIIKLPAKWHKIKECPLCYGVDEDGKKIDQKPLFETDKSSLTPALIFGKPKGKTKTLEGEIESNVSFNDLKFEESLKYKRVFRNNNYRIYYIETDKFIEKNLPEIKSWLRTIVKKSLKLDSADKVVIVAPCHESNSRFLNLVNEIVFSSSATIIHYQNNVDFAENFKLLNKNYLGEETKLFYVDDSLITGKHFFEVFNLVKDVFQNRIIFTSSIFLKDKSEPHTHNEIIELSNLFFAFASLNQPPALNILEQRPLEHERQRYETLSKTALHDVTAEFFQNRANGLNPSKLKNINDDDKDKYKELRRLKNFEATHKIFDYFARNPLNEDYDIDKIVDFKESSDNSDINLFPKYIQEIEKKRVEQRKDNPKALLKVLSQYPFILYQPLRVKTFNWLNGWLNEIKEPNENSFEKIDYDDFQTIKFLLRRATLLGNYMVLEKAFLQKILIWFIKIDKYFKGNSTKPLEDLEVTNLKDFPIYVLRNYVEMIQKNGWVAYHILNNIRDLKSDMQKSRQGLQFLHMIQIESALVIDDFYEMITKEKRFGWRDMFKDDKILIEETDKIVRFFNNRSNTDLLDSNKYLIVKETFLNNTDEWKNPKTPFCNYLWIKQLLFVDCIDKNSHFPKNIDYQRKIDVIIEKMKRFFAQIPVQAFFVVTDGQQKPYVLKEKQNLLIDFNEEFNIDKQIKELSEEIKFLIEQKGTIKNEELANLSGKKEKKEKLELEKKKHKTQILIDFLNGIDCSTGSAPETTAEYYRNHSEKDIQDEFDKNPENKNLEVVSLDLFSNPRPNFNLARWTDAYNKKTASIPFMPKDSKWLYLMRITKRNEHNNKFDVLGLLGFYSTENLYNSDESLLPKQLLMLLRQDMGKFIEKHHKNDEFAGLRQQIEKNKYVFRLNHGVGTYEDAIEDILKSCVDIDIKDNLQTFYDYLITKLEIIDKLGSKSEIELISLNRIKEEFNKRYKSILSLNVNSIDGFKKDDINKLVKINFISFDELNEEFSFPKNSIKDIVFELINNIRKNVRNRDTFLITTATPLIINIAIIEEDRKKFLSVTNNHVRNLDKPYSEEDIPHGIDLLKQMWTTHNLGKIIIPDYPLKNDSFTIKLQLKK